MKTILLKGTKFIHLYDKCVNLTICQTGVYWCVLSNTDKNTEEKTFLDGSEGGGVLFVRDTLAVMNIHYAYEV